MREYPKLFRKHLTYSIGSLEETKCWLEFANHCGYIQNLEYANLIIKAEEIGAKLYLFRKSIK